MFGRRRPAVPLRGVHLDLKGHPPTPRRLLELLDLFAHLRLNVVLAEWEDTFPWRRYPELRSPTAYAPALLRRFLARAAARGIEVIPLVQCFGHAENVLSRRRFRGLREIPDDVSEFCPSCPGSARLVIELVDDVLALMGGAARRFHLGGDEAWHMGSCPRCRRAIRTGDKDRLYMRHVAPILDHLNARGVRPILWDDMMRPWSPPALRALGARADLMAWSYGADPVQPGGHGLTERHLAGYRRGGVTVWGASAYKGGDGPFAMVPDVRARTANNLAWARLARRHRLAGVVATAWSRYTTFMAPCETIEASQHTLALAAAAMWDGALPRDPEAGARAVLKRFRRGRELRRFTRCHGAARELDAWARGFEEWLIDEAERAPHLHGEPRRINPGVIRHRAAQVRRQFARGEALGKALVRAHRGSIPRRRLDLYVASRLGPLRLRNRGVSH